ncbi:MAG: T9SS type A sorting domain-containing protein [Bacteroidetes bacterium]|nr:T9SS type A sorting domain-containing protein [Bacteroidota bacterium]
MKKLFLLTAAVVFAELSAYSQCGTIEVPLSEKIEASRVIFEGSVVRKSSFWNTEHTNIYTSNIIEVYKVLKGTISGTRVELVTEGGVVGTEMEIVTPGIELNENETGLFFVQPSSVTNSITAMPANLKFEPAVNVQSFIKYDLVDRVATDAHKVYTDVEKELYGVIKNKSGQDHKVIKQFNISQTKNAAKTSSAPVISSFSPTTITAGTLSVLTINGSGFGTNSGSAKVEFKNADDGGSSYNTVPASNISSWSDGQIQVMVPSKAGTGTFRVTDNTGSSIVSNNSLTITYDQMTYHDGSKENRLNLTNQNTTGGYTFQYNSSFKTNTAAVAAFERALKTWRCATLCNYTIGNTTTSVGCQGQDGVNIVSFDNGCILGGSLLGKTFTFYSACTKNSVSYWILKEVDIQFAASAAGGSWNYGPGATSGTKVYDFESTALHEIAHAQLEAHVINIPKLMHWTRNAATDVRTLDAAIDIACNNDNIARSLTNNPCGATGHVKISAGVCSVIGIDESTANNPGVSIYPHPFDNSATLSLDPELLRSAGPVSLALFDIIGNQARVPVNISSENYVLSRDGLSNGVYFYQLKNEEKVFATGKLILTGSR